MRLIRGLRLAALVSLAAGCQQAPSTPPSAAAPAAPRAGSFADDLAFLRAHTDVIVLKSADGRSSLAVAPAYQGRVMTTTADGEAGDSYGYIHRPGVAAGTRAPHMTVLGGEDRFWLGPEGGQYALYFAPGAKFDTDHWQVPEPIDWGGWPVSSQNDREVTFSEPMSLENYAGTPFTLRVDRAIRLLDASDVSKIIGGTPGPSLHAVAFESDNRVTNTGTTAWTKPAGLVSIWIIGQFRPSDATTIVVPFKKGPESSLGPPVNDAYFGAPPANRLHVGDGVVFFRGDGKSRGKIGIPAPRARNVVASYGADSRVLTIVTFDLPAHADGYVNSMWEHQKNPYGGDVVNSYNDGPLGPGQPPLGPFYELETSSPAAALAPKATIELVRRTVHLQGSEADLNAVATRVLGVSLADMAAGLPAAPAPANGSK